MNRQRITSGIISVILSIVMIIGICPVIDFTASAASEITGITIVDIAIPRPGVTPDYSATYSNGCTSTKRFDSETQKNGVIWGYKKVNTWKDLKPTDTFKENVQYTVAIVVHAKEGFTFRTKNGSPSLLCTVNGNKANVTGITGQNSSNTVVVTYTFPAAEYFIINTVGIKNVEIPKLGEKPDFTADVISDRYTLSSLSWYDETARKTLTSSDVFQANHNYTLEAFVRANDGTKLKTDGDDGPDFTAKINGVNAELIYAATNGGKAAGIKMTYEVTPVISKISVSDIEVPKAGNRADYTCNIDGVGYELDTYGIDWTKNAGYGSELPVKEEFIAGQSYELKIWLIAKEGFSFKTDGLGDVIADVYINGNKGEVYISDSKRCQIIYVYTVPEEITSVGVTGITEPFAGGTADMSGTVTGTGYEIANIEWYDSTDGYGNYINNITSFSEGREYTLDIYIATTGNNSFRLDPDYDIPDISASINGKGARVYSEGGRDEAIIFIKYKTPVEVVTVTGIDAPVAGAKPDTEAVSTKAGYKITKVEWYDTTKTPHVKLSATDKFEAGHTYTVQITLYAINDFVFLVEDGYQDISATINGNEAIAYGSHEYGTATIGYKFSVPAPHTHTPSEWKTDKDNHWKICTDTACGEITSAKEKHSDNNGDEKCDKCAYSMPKPIPAEMILKDGSAYKVSHLDKTVIITADDTVSAVSGSILNESFIILTSDKKTADNTSPAGTGMIIQILGKDNKILNEYMVIVLFDVDGNGKIQAADARLALRASVELENLSGVYKTAADTDGDGVIKAADARKILRTSVGLE